MGSWWWELRDFPRYPQMCRPSHSPSSPWMSPTPADSLPVTSCSLWPVSTCLARSCPRPSYDGRKDVKDESNKLFYWFRLQLFTEVMTSLNPSRRMIRLTRQDTPCPTYEFPSDPCPMDQFLIDHCQALESRRKEEWGYAGYTNSTIFHWPNYLPSDCTSEHYLCLFSFTIPWPNKFIQSLALFQYRSFSKSHFP